ncbi:aerobic respiration control sensor protein arcB [Pseudomassariella vexata]|uniref:Aerobic respiration control sensor protein arcB n=1 Tax=Pseudomassariella vexata TaxID=1141098 RepID=A0A1Y2DQE6_9PEZI|nr:aerobic respiration control sensor protein arcB [Pseudomassariella vexata]ORY61513.1 aerobic respiration control sensor protein arcB [Pseudomassariella vexata]
MTDPNLLQGQALEAGTNVDRPLEDYVDQDGIDLDLDLDQDILNSLNEFNLVNITEVLDQDSRPTFAVDLDPDEGTTINTERIWPIFCNSALRSHERLLDVVLGKSTEDQAGTTASSYEDFSIWATGVTKFDDSKDVFPLQFQFRDMLWTGSTVRKRWRLISGNLLMASIPARDLSLAAPKDFPRVEQPAKRKLSMQTDASGTLISSKPRTSFPSKLSGPSSSDSSALWQKSTLFLAAPDTCTDWTVAENQLKGTLTPHIAFARTVRWADTPLGAMEKWSPEFRQTANLVMQNPHPCALFWGSDLTMLYNEAYAVEVSGNKHPSLMGTGFSGPFSELWDSVSPIFAECARTGISIRKEDDYLPIERFGFLEETFFSWSWTPLYGGTNRILGFYNAPFETTQSVLSHRRMKTVNKVGENVSRAKTIKQFWKLTLDGLQDNIFDVPFALLYSVGESEEGADDTSISSGSTLSLKSCYYEGSIGIPEGHVAAPQQLDLKRSQSGFVPAFRLAMRLRDPTLLHTRDGTLPEELLDGINWRGFGDPCTEAIIFPVRPTNGDMVLAFLLIGVNPRRPYDNGYKAFAIILHRQLATSLASFMLYEEEVRRNRDAAEAAALEQAQLSQQLAMQTSRLRRMTELSPLGMFLVSPEGVLQEGNDCYFTMTGHPRDNLYEMSWMEQLEESSRKTMEEAWRQMVEGRKSWSGEVQLKKFNVHPVDLNDEAIEYWVLVTAQPEIASDGSVRSVMGSLIDVSHVRWARGLQDRRLQEAEETRRQQNEFIDITSHEMRNPLSAILQCADDIVSTLISHCSRDAPMSTVDVESCLDAAQTISLCVQHQKSIVDDILTVSKLDSNLLVITPIVAQPIEIIRRVRRMFVPELQSKDIQMEINIDSSFGELDVNYVTLDPSRVLQVLINLVTNAIKFTAPAATTPKRIVISVGVSNDPPLTVKPRLSDFQYIPPRSPNVTVAADDYDWGPGEVLYLAFDVADTGIGLTPDEKRVLFERFSQASPRTHAHYGGSGLGLFISRQLAELHGGQIGVASKAASGSTFGFFIKVGRAGPPDNNPVSIMSEDTLPIECDVVGETALSQPAVPQRQDFASVNSATSGLAAAKVVPKSVFDPRNIDILVVEDNLVNQNVLVKQLKKVGSGVSVANNGLEALNFLRETEYQKPGGQRLSVILMDLEMPVMDGLTCVRTIRKMEKEGAFNKHVPVIAVTANVRQEQITAAKASGMDDVVSKPFRVPDLMKKIGILLAASDTTSSGHDS